MKKSSSVTLISKDDSVHCILSCDQCKHTTKTEKNMLKRRKKEHNIEQIDGNISVGKDSFKCNHCEKDLETEVAWLNNTKFYITENKNLQTCTGGVVTFSTGQYILQDSN